MDTQTSHRLLDKIAKVKTAQDPASNSPGLVLDTEAIESSARERAVHNILKAGLIAGGGAVGVRSAQGLWNLLTRANTAPPSRVGVAPLPVPYPAKEEEEDEEGRQLKVAQDDYIKAHPNDYASWYWPSMLAAALAGGYGGWQLSDSFFDERRKEEAEDELESAKTDFQEALTSHYDVPEAKLAAEKTAARKLGEELDSLFTRFEKYGEGPLEATMRGLGGVLSLPGQAIDTLTSPQFHDKLKGGYGVYAIPTALAGYLAAKHIADKNSERKVLEKAMRRRAAKNYAKRPSELYAVPDPQIAGREEDEE